MIREPLAETITDGPRWLTALVSRYGRKSYAVHLIDPATGRQTGPIEMHTSRAEAVSCAHRLVRQSEVSHD